MSNGLPSFVSRLRSRYRTWKAARYGARFGDAEIALLPALVARDETSVDVGANRGIYTAQLVRLSKEVVAVEPYPAEAKVLREGYGRNVKVMECALSNTSGRLTLWVPLRDGDDLPTRSSLEPDANPDFASRPIEVEVRTLDSLGLDRLGFLKVHVGGHELAVLEGGRQTLERCRPTILVSGEVRFSPDLPERLAAFLGGLGYGGHFLEKGRLRPVAAFDAAIHQRPENVKRPRQPGGICAEYIYNFLYIHPSRGGVLQRLEDRLSNERAQCRKP